MTIGFGKMILKDHNLIEKGRYDILYFRSYWNTTLMHSRTANVYYAVTLTILLA